MATITVSASYYSLCDGSNGACGDCNNNEMQAAWANLAGGYGNNVSSCGSCNGVSGSTLFALSCGENIEVTDLCEGIGSEVTITDHDSPGGCLCDSQCGYEGLRVMDMTEYTFYWFEGSYTRGHIPVSVDNLDD